MLVGYIMKGVNWAFGGFLAVGIAELYDLTLDVFWFIFPNSTL
jgi:hypothetical protein